MPKPTCELPQCKGKLKGGKGKAKARTSREGAKETGKESAEPLREFFTQYQGFEYNPHESASTQFDRLRTAQGWKKGDPDQVKAWEGYLTALVKQFYVSYGKDIEDLAAWHGLLARIGLTELPKSVRSCKKVSGSGFAKPKDR